MGLLTNAGSLSTELRCFLGLSILRWPINLCDSLNISGRVDSKSSHRSLDQVTFSLTPKEDPVSVG